MSTVCDSKFRLFDSYSTNQFLVPNTFNHVDMWKKLEAAVSLGQIKHLGVSNFDNDQVQECDLSLIFTELINIIQLIFNNTE